LPRLLQSSCSCFRVLSSSARDHRHAERRHETHPRKC
jgi:hypothetical protein